MTQRKFTDLELMKFAMGRTKSLMDCLWEDMKYLDEYEEMTEEQQEVLQGYAKHELCQELHNRIFKMFNEEIPHND